MRTFTKIIFLFFIVFLVSTSCKKRREMLNARVTPHDFLSSAKYEKLIIEVDYVAGYAPTEASITTLKSFLGSLLNKPSGIEVKTSAISSGSASVYSISDIREIEKNNRRELTKGNTITVYVLFLDKEYAETAGSQTKTLGINYSSSSIVMFENTIRQFSGGLTQPSHTTLETIVWEHEFGHVLGLTNNGTAMQVNHQDSPHGAHCSNKNCLMYYLAETSDIIANLTGNNVPQLDDNCKADLRANGGK